MHKNSYLARKELIMSGKKKTREQLIFEHLYYGDKQLTMRQLLRALFPFSDDMNKIRPRGCDMVADGALRVCGETLEDGLPVMIVEVNWPVEIRPQMTLF